MRRQQIVAGQVYHVLSRGANKQNIFYDEEDYVRFIHDLFEFNDINPINNGTYRFNQQYKVTGTPYIGANNREPRKLLVELLVFCLMKNHYHLLIIPKTDDALQRFMHRLNMGFSRYMREKHGRSGTLFEGPYKVIPVAQDAHLLHLPFYIHLNPLDYFMPKWRERELQDFKKAFAFIQKYKWSSFQDYIGIKNFPSVTQRDFLINFFDGPDQYKKAVIDWLKSMDLSGIENLLLE